MEPASAVYMDPVIVLDFQSLYPTMMIAYNICYSCCLGKAPRGHADAVSGVGQAKRFGTSHLRVPADTLAPLEPEDVNLLPNGAMFVKPHVRQGVLPRMLSELLETRKMVKASMGMYKGEDPGLHHELNSRQLGLKMISNVTYGYTSANFSGRMPCVDIADSIGETVKCVPGCEKWIGM